MILTFVLHCSSKKMVPAAVVAIAAGLVMVGFYSWQVSVVTNCDINHPNATQECSYGPGSKHESQCKLYMPIININFGEAI